MRRYHVALPLLGALPAGQIWYIFAVLNQFAQSPILCTQTHQQLSLRDPVRGRGNPYSRPLVSFEGVPGESLGRSPGLLYPFSFCGGASGGPLSLPPKKAAKETAKGDLFRGGPLWDPSPTTKGAPPPSNPNGGRKNGDGRDGRPGTGVTDCHNQ